VKLGKIICPKEKTGLEAGSGGEGKIEDIKAKLYFL
jgi:hypothetical protein